MKTQKLTTKVTFMLAVLLSCATMPLQAFADDRYDISYFFTPYGQSVQISTLKQGLTPYTEPVDLSNYPSAVLVESGDDTYNCFTYALIFDGHIERISRLSRAQKFSIDQGDPIIKYNPCLTQVTFAQSQVGDLIGYEYQQCDDPLGVYYGLTEFRHVGIMTQKGSDIKSSYAIAKWGKSNVYESRVDDTPYGKPENITQRTTNNGEPPSAVLPQVHIYIYRISHDYTYSALIESSPVPAFQVSRCHYAYCSDCGAYHYEAHDYSKVVCSKCGYFNDVSINNFSLEVIE